MKKACILTTVHPRFDTRVFSREARSIAHNYNTVLLVADELPSQKRDGVSIRSVVGRKPKNRLERMFLFTNIMYREAMRENADIYHFHDTELFFVGMRLKRAGKKVVYDAHESIADTILERDYLPYPFLRFISYVMIHMERYVARRMDAVVTVTPFLRERFTDWGCCTYLVCNFPVVEDFSEGDTRWEDRQSAACYAGSRVDIDRGVFEMTTAAQLGGFPLHFFGWLTDSVKNEVNAIDCNKLLTMHGTVPHEEIRKALQHTCIGIVAEHATGNNRNAYCIKMFEYMASGMAIVTSNIPLWEEIVLGSKCGISVDPQQPEAIAKAVNYLLSHPKEAEAMGKAGRQAAIEKYNWTGQKKILLALYEKLTGEP